MIRGRARLVVLGAAALAGGGALAIVLVLTRPVSHGGAPDAGAALTDGGVERGDGGDAVAARASSIAGRVVDRRGRAAAGAEVWLGGAALATDGVRKLRVGPSGEFAFTELPPGRYALRAFRTGEAAFLDGLEPGTTAPPVQGDGASARPPHSDGGASARTLYGDGGASARTLHGDGSASARTLHSDGGASARTLPGDGSASARPLHSDGSASARPLHSDGSASARPLHSDGSASARPLHSDGSASARTLHGDGGASARTLHGDGGSGARAQDDRDNGGAGARSRGDGGAPLFTVELAPAAAIVGRLRERSGAAIGGGEVALVESGSEAAAFLARRATTGSDGTFRLEGVEPGAFLVFARAEGFLSPAPLALAVALDAAPLDVRLDRGARLDGRVVDEQGRAIAGAQVEVAGEGEGGAPIALTAADAAEWPRRAPDSPRLELSGELGILRGPIPFPPATPRPGAAPQRAFLSDARGAFHLPGVPVGRVVVAASHPDFARGASAEVAVAAGATAVVEVVLRRGRTVRGRVSDERGAPLGGAELLVDGRALTASDARGEFTLAHLVGAVTVGARLPGFVAQIRAVGADETDVELKLERAEARLAGVVVDERGAPVAGAKVELVAGGQPPRALTSDRTGAFRADGLPPGPYRVRVEHADYAPLTDEVAGPADDVRLQLDPGAGLTGEVRDARSGGVPSGAKLELSTGGAVRALSLDRGRFEATGLKPGRARLSASAPGFQPWSRELDLSGGERPREVTLRDLTVELERGGAVAGTVLDEDGQPVAGAELSLAGGASSLVRGRSDARGEFRLDGLSPGRLELRAESGGRRAEELVEVRADDETRLELRLAPYRR